MTVKKEGKSEHLTIKIVSEKEMYEISPLLRMKFITDPFALEPKDPRMEAKKLLSRGVTIDMASVLMKKLYTQEANDLITKLLKEGKREFYITETNLYAK